MEQQLINSFVVVVVVVVVVAAVVVAVVVVFYCNETCASSAPLSIFPPTCFFLSYFIFQLHQVQE